MERRRPRSCWIWSDTAVAVVATLKFCCYTNELNYNAVCIACLQILWQCCFAKLRML